MHWTQMSEFDGVDLTESYVLGWRMDGDDLRFDLDVALVPGHPAYRAPGPDERTCYRRGTLTFPSAHAVVGLERQEAVRATVDASGERDYGNIDTFDDANGEFQLSGDFGDVRVKSGRPRLDV